MFLLPELEFLLNQIPSLQYLVYEPEPLMPVFFIGAVAIFLGAPNANELMKSFRPTPGRLLFTVTLLTLSILSFGSVSTFLYFNF